MKKNIFTTSAYVLISVLSQFISTSGETSEKIITSQSYRRPQITITNNTGKTIVGRIFHIGFDGTQIISEPTTISNNTSAHMWRPLKWCNMDTVFLFAPESNQNAAQLLQTIKQDGKVLFKVDKQSELNNALDNQEIRRLNVESIQGNHFTLNQYAFDYVGCVLPLTDQRPQKELAILQSENE